MTQTSDGMTFVQAKAYISDDDGATWTDASGHGASISLGGGERASGEQNTFDGTLPIVKAADRAATDLTLSFVYTEAVSEPFDKARDVHESDDPLFMVAYLTKTGGQWYTTASGSVLTNVTYPQGEANSGDVILCDIVVKSPGILKIIAPSL